MTFSHKTVNILFHIRKFLSGKDALNTLYGSDCFKANTNTDFLQATLYLYSVYIARLPQNDTNQHIIWYYETRMA